MRKLLSDAAEFTEEVSISVSPRPMKSGVALGVTDTGAGNGPLIGK